MARRTEPPNEGFTVSPQTRRHTRRKHLCNKRKRASQNGKKVRKNLDEEVWNYRFAFPKPTEIDVTWVVLFEGGSTGHCVSHCREQQDAGMRSAFLIGWEHEIHSNDTAVC